MGALIRIAVGLALVVASGPTAAQPAWAPYVAEASARFGVPVAWIRRVIAAESGGRTHLDGRPITSPAGAMGLMQLMPGTWAEMRARLGLGDDPYDPRDNILAGTFYLRLMYEQFGYPGMFGAYNAGPGRYGEYLRTGRALPDETRVYMSAIVRTSPRRPPKTDALPFDAIFFSLVPVPAPLPTAIQDRDPQGRDPIFVRFENH